MEYVLVCDVSDNGKYYYYCGYYENGVPVNTNTFSKAMVVSTYSLAKSICENINNQKNCPFKYFVELR